MIYHKSNIKGKVLWQQDGFEMIRHENSYFMIKDGYVIDVHFGRRNPEEWLEKIRERELKNIEDLKIRARRLNMDIRLMEEMWDRNYVK
jgi:hypothetical protein